MPLHVSIIHLALDNPGFDAQLQSYQQVLDEDELQRLHRFKNPHAASTFLQARYMVKKSLAEVCECTPNDIRFIYSDTGKPQLHGHIAQKGWHFSVSHSKQHIVIALAQDNIGVDVEDVKRCADLVPKTAEFLNQHAKQLIAQCKTPVEAAERFTEYWCCLESFVKLRGSAIWQEKEKVQPVLQDETPTARHLTFENAHFTCLTAHPEFRIVLASYSDRTEIEYIPWQVRR
ncbi:4'-phosphopantetheinyl transferase sfp [Thalassocella blandensis]|nr:4'-phosphopantetheinyl transferase sfp [Thalassocella blandensis]